MTEGEKAFVFSSLHSEQAGKDGVGRATRRDAVRDPRVYALALAYLIDPPASSS